MRCGLHDSKPQLCSLGQPMVASNRAMTAGRQYPPVVRPARSQCSLLRHFQTACACSQFAKLIKEANSCPH